ncbi:MAG TPA: DNA-deoxyinosine glycosylase [Burkholderiaceae bacterium]|nr:DNA-deoxyinosine glycosylase [Burkholderiaceae bacterium]
MQTAGAGRRQVGLAPVVHAHTRVLILGSFPGAASLAAQRYYAHPQNHFWFLLSAILNEPLIHWPYALRCERLLARGIGLWDVLGACQREGSLDSAIEAGEPNDPAAVLGMAPRLERACFNGAFAQAHQHVWADAGLQVLSVPSSSPANAGQRFDHKLAVWRAALHLEGRP